MDIVRECWQRDVECAHCGSTLRIEATDVRARLIQNVAPGDGYVMKAYKPEYFVECASCTNPMVLQSGFDGTLPVKVRRIAEIGSEVDIDTIKTLELEV